MIRGQNPGTDTPIFIHNLPVIIITRDYEWSAVIHGKANLTVFDWL